MITVVMISPSSIVCANLFLFGLIIRFAINHLNCVVVLKLIYLVREILGTRSSVPRNIDSKTELKKQMVRW